ncbi:hypothetical protein ACOSQ4_010923 [Xanthoceras sorbifolium]
MFTAVDPIHFEDTVKSEKWRQAMDVEMAAIKRNDTWELTELPEGGKKIGVKWVYKTKFNENGEVDKYKAWLVVKGYSQQHGVDYTEVFAPVARMETIRLVVACAAQRGWDIYQLDVKSAFLYGELNEEVFVQQPCGYIQKGHEHKVYKLKKTLYGLKQASRAWYSRIEAYFIKEGFEKCDYKHTLFIKAENRGCKLMKDEGGIKVDKTQFTQIVGSLMYLIATRPDVMSIVGLISRYMENATELHQQVAKRVLRYLRGTLDFGLFYKKGGNSKLVAYTDSDYAGDLEDRKSTTGYVFLLSSAAVSWLSKKQPVVSLSTTEAEFIDVASCACQAVWLKRVLDMLSLNQDQTTAIYCDNSSAIKLSKNPVMHGHNKYIDVRFHFLRELTKAGSVELIYCSTQNQLAHVMTKPLKLDVFLKMRATLGVCCEADIN